MRLPVLAITAICGLLTLPAVAEVTVTNKVFINGVEGKSIMPGEPAVLETKFIVEKEGEDPKPLKDVKMLMGKTMHYVIIKKDLSEFAHFHPTFDMGTGIFQIPLHLPMYSPDNKDAQFAMSTPGDYLLYAETVSEQMGMVIRGVDYSTIGKPVVQSLDLDQRNPDGSYSVYVDENNQKAQEGAKYRFDVAISTLAGQGGDLIYFDGTLNKLDGKDYIEVEKLQPWLMMGGHAIVISQAGETAAEKVFEHFHADLPPEGGKLRFNHFARGGLPEGIYKTWMQVKHDGTILKIPLAFEYNSAE